MKQMLRPLPCLLAIGAIAAAAPAQAHFKLIKPASWIVEDELGDPQKSGPCGPEGSGGMMTNEITTVEAGSTLEVEYVETIHHPGWFRIALAADRSEFEEIEFPNTTDCNYDMTTVPEEPHGNVLADGLAKDENLGGSNRTFKETVKIPNEPCEKCTLQVIQVMADSIHRPPGCIYYHCADLKIVAANSGTTAAAGSSGSAGAAGAATGGSSAAGSAGTAAPASGGTGGATSTSSAGAGGSATKPAATPASSGSAGTGTASGSATAASGSAGKAATPAPTGGVAGSSSSGKAETTTPATPTTTTQETAPAEESGCSVSAPGARSDIASAALLSVVGLLLGARRRQRRAA